MKIYSVSHYTSPTGGSEHDGYTYHTSKREALKEVRRSRSLEGARQWGYEKEEDLIHVGNFELNKNGMLNALKFFGSHPNNG